MIAETYTDERLQSILHPRPVRFYSRVDSTNDLAADWLKSGASQGAVVIADEQMKGRGRMGRFWHTPPNSALAVSVILHPPVEALHQVSMLGALAIAELCDHLSIQQVGIKWPNDVQIGFRKVSGVLPEAVWEGTKLIGVILGMGVNVRVQFTDTALLNSAATIELALGRPVDRVDLLVYLLERVEYWVARLNTTVLFDTWKGRLNMLGRSVKVMNGEVSLSGIAEDVDEQGGLLLRTDEGDIHRVLAGDLLMV